MINWKKILAVGCLFCFVASPTTALAENLQDKLEGYQQQKSQLNSQLTAQKKQVDAATQQITALNQTIKALNDSINTYKADISKQQAHLNELDVKQKKLNQDKSDRVNQLNKFIRANYEDGGISYLSLIMGSSNLSDLFDRVYQVKCIIDKYNQLIVDINKLTKDIDDQQTQITEKKAALQTALKDKESTQNYSQQLLAKQQSVYSQLSAQQKATATAAANAQNNIDIVEEQIRQEEWERKQAEQEGQNGNSSDSGGGVTDPVHLGGGAGAVVDFAMNYVGVPYVWGGTSPSGWDCSGFVKYVYGHFGVSLPRVSQDQYRCGSAVSKSDLRPGDLVFFSTYTSGASHVGIYIGGGKMVNAASTRRGTIVDNISDSYWGPRYLGARRVVIP